MGCFSLHLSELKRALTPRGMQGQPYKKKTDHYLDILAPKQASDLGMDFNTQSHGVRVLVLKIW